MTLVPDRTCRLKFPVVAEELIEYSGARHGERSRRDLGSKTLDFRRENFCRRRHRHHRKMRARERRKGVAMPRQMANSSPLSRFSSEKFRPSLFHSLIITRPCD